MAHGNMSLVLCVCVCVEQTGNANLLRDLETIGSGISGMIWGASPTSTHGAAAAAGSGPKASDPAAAAHDIVAQKLDGQAHTADWEKVRAGGPMDEVGVGVGMVGVDWNGYGRKEWE